MKHDDFSSVYERRQRATLEDARAEAHAVIEAFRRIEAAAGSGERGGDDLAAGKLFEIANEVSSAETAYRRSLAASSQSNEATVRLAVVLIKQKRYDEAIRIANDLFINDPNLVVKSLVYEGPLSLCTVLGDAQRLSGNYAAAAGFYREAAKVERGSPYSVGQAVITMAMAGEGDAIADFADKHETFATDRIASVVRLAREGDSRLAVVKQVAQLANVGAAESMMMNPLDLVSR